MAIDCPEDQISAPTSSTAEMHHGDHNNQAHSPWADSVSAGLRCLTTDTW